MISLILITILPFTLAVPLSDLGGLLPDYSVCKTDKQCFSNRCHSSKICLPEYGRIISSYCFVDAQCASGNCQNSTCTSLPTKTKASPTPTPIYKLQDTWDHTNFFNDFVFRGDLLEWNLTHGNVDYVDKSHAIAQNLISINTQNQIVMEVGQQVSYFDTNRKGDIRNSVRVNSPKTYNGGLFILDVEHMPSGHSVWPAFWLASPLQNGNVISTTWPAPASEYWPGYGEIDVMEYFGYTSDSTMTDFNTMTLHTGAECQMNFPSTPSGMLGQQPSWASNQCGTPNEFSACPVESPHNKNASGSSFNTNKGGIYAMEWTNSSIKVWFSPRNADITSPLGQAIKQANPDPKTFGTPVAYFPIGSGSSCSSDHFHDLAIIFDTTLCGDAINSRWDKSIAPTCPDYVQNGDYSQAYWAINSLKTFILQ